MLYCTNYKLITRGILIRTRAREVCTSRPVCHALVSSQGHRTQNPWCQKSNKIYLGTGCQHAELSRISSDHLSCYP